jgi:AAA+ ATPase superfamily predicted ATPase
MFLGREKEMQVLKANFQAEEFQFTIIYGHRRVGKTTLISEPVNLSP